VSDVRTGEMTGETGDAVAPEAGGAQLICGDVGLPRPVLEIGTDEKLVSVLLRLQAAGERRGKKNAADERGLDLPDAALEGIRPHALGVGGLLLVAALGVAAQAQIHDAIGHRRAGDLAEARDLREVALDMVPLGLHPGHEDRIATGTAHARAAPLR